MRHWRGEGSDLCFQKLKCFSPGIAVKFNCTLELLMLHTFEVCKHAVQVSCTCNQKNIVVGMHRREQCVTPARECWRSEIELHKLASVHTTSVEIAPNAYLF